jgi:hypothetical protein
MRELCNPLSRLVRLSVQNLDIEAGDAAVAPGNLVELLAGDDGGDVVLGPADALLDHLQHALGTEPAVAADDRGGRRQTLRGVPQQGDAPKAPALDRIAIDHRVFKDAFRAAEQRRKIDEAELLTGEVRQEILETNPSEPQLIRTERGAGYIFAAAVEIL